MKKIEPPHPDHAAATFAGLESRAERVRRLIDELDAFYARAEAPLWSAVRDQDRVAPLAEFLTKLGKGVRAWVAEALEEHSEADLVTMAAALADFTVWRALSRAGLGVPERKAVLVEAIRAAVEKAATNRGVPEDLARGAGSLSRT